MSRLQERVAPFFAADGPLGRIFPGYEERPQQRQMAEAVAQAWDDHDRVVIEAATGTGKTLAYLLPAVLSRRTTVVSTATKNLQDQIVDKDVPLLQQVVGRPIDAVLLKGRSNYLCLWQYDSFAEAPRFRRESDTRQWPMVESWARETTTGDRAELAGLPDDWPTWAELTVGSDTCLGQSCPRYGDCFVVKARQRAARADLVVVNHHLFFADLALRQRKQGELLPDYEALIFDEAHHIEETAGAFFGLTFSNWRVSDLLTDVRSMMGREGLVDEALGTLLADCELDLQVWLQAFLAALPESSDSRVELERLQTGPAGEDLDEATRALLELLARLHERLELSRDRADVLPRLAERASELATDLHSLYHQESADRMMHFVERRGRGVFLQAWPIDLRPIFEELVYRTCAIQVFTSATLSTDADFRFFRQRIALPKETRELRLEPVFDYMKQSILYVPEDLPRPDDPQFIERAVPTMLELLRITEGRAFLLFTSWRNMQRAHELLRRRIPWRVLRQGDQSRSSLLDAFRQDTHSVLFGTSSFWEGVDVQGESLSLVIIDKLPFASPGDPITRARLAHLESQGLAPFAHYQIPQAVIALKQGVGRLIRHRDDRGIMAVLDSRLVTAHYRDRFLDSLPRGRRTRRLDMVRAWWETTRTRDLGGIVP
jgi:ATP-dependent DNA helicase DinG